MRALVFDWTGTLWAPEGVFPYAERVLEQLSERYLLGLVTMDKGEERYAEIENSGLLRFMSAFIMTNKKTLATYRGCIESMGVLPTETGIVDDRTRKGIMIGNQLGCRTYWIQQGNYAHEVPDEETGEPTERINTIEDLVPLLL